MASNYIKTMKDLEAATYGVKGGLGGNALLKSAGVVAGLHGHHDGASAGSNLGTGTTAASGLTSLYNLTHWLCWLKDPILQVVGEL
jgi:hypothetical protein